MIRPPVRAQPFCIDREGSLLPKHSRKRQVLHRRDRRVDLGPAGRNLFISRDKQLQSRQVRRIKWGMRVVLALGVFVGAVGLGIFAAFYIVPYFQSEMLLESSSSQAESSASQVDLTTYDEMGLPVYSNEISLFVINRDNPAEASYVPDTVEVEGVQVEAHMANALQMLVEAAKADGLALTFTEGYVSYGEQEQRFQAEVERLMTEEGLTTVMANTQARLTVPMAGECDQQTGLCVQLEGDPETFPGSRTCSWLRSNMGKYGFVFRYPEDKEDYTGCTGNLTVLRYVGSENATAMAQRSLCLEEYITYLARQ